MLGPIKRMKRLLFESAAGFVFLVLWRLSFFMINYFILLNDLVYFALVLIPVTVALVVAKKSCLLMIVLSK